MVLDDRAIWKEPVQGRRMVRRLNIDGGDQADRQAHGGEHRAVFVYHAEAYRYWQTQLGRFRSRRVAAGAAPRPTP